MKTKFPLLLAVLAGGFLLLHELLWAQPAPFNFPAAADLSGVPAATAFNANQFTASASSVSVKSGSLVTNANFYAQTNHGDVLFGTDNTSSIGANGANRPANVNVANIVKVGGSLWVGVINNAAADPRISSLAFITFKPLP